jgi:hypothetical protein
VQRSTAGMRQLYRTLYHCLMARQQPRMDPDHCCTLVGQGLGFPGTNSPSMLLAVQAECGVLTKNTITGPDVHVSDVTDQSFVVSCAQARLFLVIVIGGMT